MRHAALVAVALALLPAAAARGQSTAEPVGKLQQQASAARLSGPDEKSSRLLLALEAELASDRYPSPAALAGLATELSRAGSGLAVLAPDVKLLAARLLALAETSLAETCRLSAASPANWSAADLNDERRLLRQALDRCRVRLNTIRTGQRTAWEEYLFWNETRSLAEGASLEESALQRLEARWTNFHLAWNDPELTRTALAVRRFIRQARRAGDPPASDAIAVRLAGIAELVAEDGPLSEEAHETLSAELAELEARGIAADLTTAIRTRASHPNAVVQVSNELLVQRLAQPLDETFRIDQVVAGTRAVGDGRLTGTLSWSPVVNPAAAGWTWNMQATSASRTTGVTSGVRVDSTSSTTMSGSKPFVLDATGLSVLPASADAKTAIQYTGIAAGGGGRRRSAANSGAFAARPQAESESAASARRSVLTRLDGEAAALVSEFQSRYDRSIRSTLGRSTRLATTIRAHGDDSGQTWACWLEELHGLAAPVPAPERPSDADLATAWHASFLQRYAAEKLAGRRFTTNSLAQELEGWLGRPSSAVAEAAAKQWRLEFAPDRPVVCRITDGQVRLHLRLAEFADSKNAYPAVSVYLSYKPRQTAEGWVLARVGAAEAYPLDYEPGTGKGLSGRQLVLRQAVRRSLEATLRQEVEISPLEIKWNSAAAARRLAPRQIRAAEGWLSIDWQSPAAAASFATGP